MYRSTLNRPKKIGICSTIGRQPISGLTPASWYSFIVSAFRVSLSPLYFLRSSEIRGVSAVIARCVCICLMNSGTRISRMITTSTMIVSTQVTPLARPNSGLNRLKSCVISQATASSIGARMVLNASVPLLVGRRRNPPLVAARRALAARARRCGRAAPGQGRPRGTGGTCRADAPPAMSRGPRRAPGSPPARTRCTTGRTGSAGRAAGRRTGGNQRSARSAPARAPSAAIALPWALSALSHRTTLPPEEGPHHLSQFGGQVRLACSRGLWISAQHKKATLRQRLEIPRGQVAQPPLDPVADDRGPDRAVHGEANPGRLGGAVAYQQVADQERPARPAAAPDRSAELGAAAHPGGSGQHLAPPPRGRKRPSDADSRTALAASRREHSAPGPGAHAQPEAVRLRATAIIRLKRALAHRNSRFAGEVFGQPATARLPPQDKTSVRSRMIAARVGQGRPCPRGRRSRRRSRSRDFVPTPGPAATLPVSLTYPPHRA